MAKKQKNDIPNPNSVTNRDIMHRLNFLYQASVYLNGIDTSQEQSTSNRPKKSRRAGTKDLAKSYIDTMKLVGTKTIVRMDPSVKRTLCKGCNTVLVPGSTATVRVKGSPSHGHVMTYTCLECRTSRRIPAPPITSSTNASEDPNAMQVTAESSLSSSGSHRKGKLQKSVAPRDPPLFASSVGHVVFRGDQQMNQDDLSLHGNGSFVS